MYQPTNLRKAAFVMLVMLISWMVAGTPPKTAGQGARQQKAAPVVAKSYVCPMHEEVKSTKPGKCRKCGMALQLTQTDNRSTDTARVEPVSANAATDSLRPGPVKKMVIPDVQVLDQDGNQLHFYSDLIKGKTVAINFIFTNCTTICPPLGATFARVQKQMGDKVGRDVHFISISVDPLTDTPERLKAWGAKFKAGNGWTFVTGTKEEMDKLLNALGASVARREDHTPAVIVGNDLKDVWSRTYGLANTSQMVGLILKVMEGRVDDESSIKEQD